MAQASDTQRKIRILDAAERIFGESGFEGASLRQIVAAAKVNLATVYYYYKSKDGLLVAVLDRRLGPLKQESLDLLTQYQRDNEGKPLTVEKILEAILLPPLRLTAAATEESRSIGRLLGRIVTEPHPRMQKLLRRTHEHVRTAFQEAMQQALPHMPKVDLLWRFEFFWGALAFILVNPGKLEVVTQGVCNPADTPSVMAHMIRFFTAGFHAPPVPAAPQARSKPLST